MNNLAEQHLKEYLNDYEDYKGHCSEDDNKYDFAQNQIYEKMDLEELAHFVVLLAEKNREISKELCIHQTHFASVSKLLGSYQLKQ